MTGGASGIGKGTARRLVEHGADVVVGDIDEDGGRSLADELGVDVRAPRRRRSGGVGPGGRDERTVRHRLPQRGRLHQLRQRAGSAAGVRPRHRSRSSPCPMRRTGASCRSTSTASCSGHGRCSRRCSTPAAPTSSSPPRWPASARSRSTRCTASRSTPSSASSARWRAPSTCAPVTTSASARSAPASPTPTSSRRT